MGTPDNASDSIDYEKRFKDTQAAYTKSQQELKAAEARAKALEETLTSNIVLNPEQQAELDAIKFSDPDAWRVKINEFENAKKQEIMQSTAEQAELAKRTELLQAFNSASTVQLTDEVLEKDIPNRLKDDLASGVINFEEFLNKAQGFIKTTVNTPEIMGQPNIGNVVGSDTPNPGSEKQHAKKYEQIIF